VLRGGLIAGVLVGALVTPTATPREERLNLGVVAIEARVGGDLVRSSGAVIDADRGLVITSAHSVWGATSLRVATGLGVVYGRLVARAPCTDLALVETQPRLPGLVALTGGDAPEPDELLTAVGRRRTDPEAGTFGLLTIPTTAAELGAEQRVDPRLPPVADAIVLDGPLVADASGGPIVAREGPIVALATVGKTAAGVPWAKVRERLRALRPGPRRIYAGWRDEYRCAPRLDAYAKAKHPRFRPRDARLTAPVRTRRLPGTKEPDA
jgi:S1-C subfamily serine protease